MDSDGASYRSGAGGTALQRRMRCAAMHPQAHARTGHSPLRAKAGGPVLHFLSVHSQPPWCVDLDGARTLSVA